MKIRAREVVITSSRKASDPNEETLHWLQCLELAKTAYIPPFQVSELNITVLVESDPKIPSKQIGASLSIAKPAHPCSSELLKASLCVTFSCSRCVCHLHVRAGRWENDELLFASLEPSLHGNQ